MYTDILLSYKWSEMSLQMVRNVPKCFWSEKSMVRNSPKRLWSDTCMVRNVRVLSLSTWHSPASSPSGTRVFMCVGVCRCVHVCLTRTHNPLNSLALNHNTRLVPSIYSRQLEYAELFIITYPFTNKTVNKARRNDDKCYILWINIG